MTEQDKQAAPVARSAKEKRLGQANSGDYVPGGTKPAKVVDTAALAAKQAENERIKTEKSELSKARSLARKESLAKNKRWIIIGGVIAAVVIVFGVVQVVVANTGSPSEVVNKYIAAMNAKNVDAFKDHDLFPLPTGAQLAPSDVISQVDTSLVGATVSYKETSAGTVATIKTTNLAQPIELTVSKSLTFNGLFTPHWAITTPLSVVTFSSAPDLPTTASISIGKLALGNSTSAKFKTLTGKPVALPFGILPVTTGQTAATDGGTTNFPIAATAVKVSVGGGPLSVTRLMSKALKTYDFSVLKPLLADSVQVLIPGQFMDASGLIVPGPIEVQTMTASEAIYALKSNNATDYPLSWKIPTPAAILSHASDWLAQNQATQFLTDKSTVAYVEDLNSISGNTYEFMSFTPDSNGKIALIWFGVGIP